MGRTKIDYAIMKILVVGKMGNGTLQAKLKPLVALDIVQDIVFVRDSLGPALDKVNYRVPSRTSMIMPVFKNMVFFHLLLQIIRKEKPAFIIGYHYLPHGIYCLLANLVTGVPIIFAQTGGRSEVLNRSSTLHARLQRKLFSKCYKFFVPGHESLRFWKENIELDLTKKLEVLHSSIDTDKFDGIGENKVFDFIFVGALNDRKNVELIIKGFSRVLSRNKSVKLAIVGKGENSDSLKELAVSLKCDHAVEFMGYHHEIINFLRLSRVFVMASKMEGLPVALMEAMAMELICIAPPVDNIPSVLKDGETGFLLKEMEEEEMEKLMSVAMRNEETLGMGKRARRIIVENYSYRSACNKWRDILNDFR
jgi:glycosyltransferase involved in cell wall biosynthesis